MRRVFVEELRLILSDGGAMLIIIFAMLIYTTIYSFAYGAEVVECVDIAVVDEDNTPSSRELIQGLRSGPNTRVSYEPQSMAEAKELLYDRKVYGVVLVPHGFERRLLSSEGATISLILDGSHLLLYSKVYEQTVTDALIQGANVEAGYLVAMGADEITAMGIIQPVKLTRQVLYNPSLGYGSFVMPSIVVVIIQQTLLIGVAMVAMRRQRGVCSTWRDSIKRVVAISFVYLLIYSITFVIIMLTIWQIFGFPMNGTVFNITLLMLLYIFASASLAQVVSHLFKHREAPIMTLMWSSVPVLLLAGVSYPREAFSEWLYAIGRLLPSSSAVDGFIRINSMGAPLRDVQTELYTLAILVVLYTAVAIWMDRRKQSKL